MSRSRHDARRQIALAAHGLVRTPLVMVAAVVSVLLISGLVVFRPWQQANFNSARGALLVCCAAGLRGPLEEIRSQYEAESGVQITMQYAGSQSLLASLEVSRTGDLFISADEQYIESARDQQLLGQSYAIARQHPVLAVRKGKPLGITTLSDLLSSDAKIAQANPDLAAIGKVTQTILERTNQWKRLKQRTSVFKTTVNEVANDLKVGAVDAGFVWDQTVFQYANDIEAVPLKEFEGWSSQVSVGVLNFSKQQPAATRFAEFLAAPEQGAQVFQRHGFSRGAADPSPAREVAP